MSSWDELTNGRPIIIGLLQVDIAGHSNLTGTSQEISKAKNIFRRRVESITKDYDGRPFSWPGDGGVFMFLISRGDEYSNMVLAATSVLRQLPNINDEIALQTHVNPPLSIRISCDAGHAIYNSDPGSMHADFINKFLKNERAIGIANCVTITERVLRELPGPLRKRFELHKNSGEVQSDIYRFDLQIGGRPAPVRGRVPDEEIIRELREVASRHKDLARRVEVTRFLSTPPKLEDMGALEVPSEKRRAAEEGIKKPFINDPHAILSVEPSWPDDPIILRYKTTDYVGICSLSDNNKNPVHVISSSVVALCAEKRELYLHRRSPESRTYPSGLHTIGGACQPVTDADLIATARREFREETKMNFSIRGATKLMIARELNTGFVQLVLLGVDVTPEEVEVKENSWEGDVVDISFDALPDKLLNAVDAGYEELPDSPAKIVPTGFMHLLAWLGLGAPPLAETERFGSYSARELYLKLIEKLKATAS